MEYLFLALIALGIPFVLPIASWVYARRTRARLEALEAVVREQASTIARLEGLLRREAVAPAAAAAPPTPAPRAAAPEQPRVPIPPVIERPKVVIPPPTPIVIPAPRVPPPESRIPSPESRVPASATATAGKPSPRPQAPRPAPAPSAAEGFDWESLVGVKLFSAIAGIALVIAAIFFLRYSIEQGWLQPPVRMAIGIVVSLALLIVCELKAARRYPSTANALDAAAIAILFSTFFAAHALWNLIPSLVAFVLLAVVTALAVLLSIRRGSLFIAVLGLLGGFATPALLSSGDNRPIPLFAYLVLLNIGLAWVAYRQRWAVLTVLTLVLTTVYQWGWVFRFLDDSQLPLAMGIFAIFPVITMAGLTFARGRVASGDAFERTALVGAALPLLFAVYLSAVPAYGAHPFLLFGFLWLIDAGLLAVAIARREGTLHLSGAVTAVTVMAVWIANSYVHRGAVPALAGGVALAILYSVAPAIAAWFTRPFDATARLASYAAPLLLFAPAIVPQVDPSTTNPWALVFAVMPIVLVVAWRAIAERRGGLYFVAAFLAVAFQASWSAVHLDVSRLTTAVRMYALFGVVSLAVPIVARRLKRPLEPRGGAGLVLLASLGLLLFLASGPIAPVALWALALLLAILNAGLFIEAAAGELPALSLAGSIVSWAVLANWWVRAAGAVGTLPSLTVLLALSLITLAGHTWTARAAARGGAGQAARFTGGLFLALGGHVFLFFLVTNPAWSLPPWPWMATLAVLTVAVSSAALLTRTPALHAAGAIAAALVMASWASIAGPEWRSLAVVAALAASAYAVLWISVDARIARPQRDRTGVVDESVAVGAGAALFVGEISAILAVASGPVPLALVVAAHVVTIATLLALAWHWRWSQIANVAVLPAAAALVVQGGEAGQLARRWNEVLTLGSALYAVFIAYPFVLARRASGARDPYVAAVLMSAVYFFAAKVALTAGGYDWGIGALPVFEGAVMALLLKQLLSLEAAGHRDLGRLALIGGAALAFVTVAIPLQLRHQWITIGWALEAAALTWLFTRVRHRGVIGTAAALFAAVFIRLAANPSVLLYEPRGSMRIVNWYLYAYLVCAAAFLFAAWWLSRRKVTGDSIASFLSRALPAGATILLFLLLNIEIADYYATGPAIVFRFGVTVSQDLTYTIGWLVFGMILLGLCIYLRSHAGRVAALVLIAVTTFKCFLYDLSSLEGLYRVASFVGLATALALVSLALQKWVLVKREAAK